MSTLKVESPLTKTSATEGGEKMKALHMVAFTLVVVGALNWGLIALLNLNLVETVFGGMGLTNIVYILVGASAVYIAATHMGDCKACGK